MKQHQYQSVKSRFTALENHFLNTFFSGIYLSPNDFINIAKQVDITLEMHTREMLIKLLLNESDSHGKLDQTIALLNKVIDERIAQYHNLSINYPGALKPLATLAQKANGTKLLLARESRGNPYEQ